MILFVTSACNLSCVFCDRRHAHAGLPGAEEIVSSGKQMDEKVVLVGGEPMLHPDLPDLIRKLHMAGSAQVVLQSNGLRAAYPSYAMKLKSCGLDRASILFPAPGPSAADRLTRRPGAYHLALRGIRNLQESGVPVRLRLPLLQPALKHLPDFLRHVTAAVPGVRAIDLVHVHTGGPRLQVRFDELAGSLPSVTDGSFSGLPRVRLDTAGGMPLCVARGMPVFEPAEEGLASPRTYGRACGKCSLRRRCPGIPDSYLAAFGHGEFKPFREGRSQGRSRADAAAGREGKTDKRRKYTKEETLKTVSTTYRCSESADGKEELYSVRLRVTLRCNLGCRFCFTPWEPKVIDEAGVEPVIISSIEAGAKKVVLTGGEPTLHASLAGLIRTARRAGAEQVELQTNGIRLEDRDFCAEIIDAGLTSVTVSLPSHRAKILERITEESGTLKKTLRGIANLVDMGLPTSIHHVICPQNHRDVPGFARFITRRFRINHLSILLAAPIKPPLARTDIIVRYSDAAPWIKEALDYCIASDVPFEGTWERCGLPLCILKGERRYYHGASRIPDANRTQDFIDAPGCPTCARRSLCYRVRMLYASLYGMEEFQPVHEHEDENERPPARRASGSGPGTDGTQGPDMTRSAEETIVKIGKRLKIDRKRLLGLYETDRENHVRLTARGRSGETKLIDGWRVQYARRSGPTSGGLEIAAGLSLDRCRSSAMFRGLQAAALAVPMGGAHGGLSCDPAWLGRAGAEEVVRLYVGMLAEELQSGNDHITSHASVPRREPGSLSPTPSVISALSAARLAARRLGIHGPKPLRCSLWGFGKAGRAIAGHIESSLGPSVFVGCADAMSASANPAGLDVERLEKNKRKTGRISRGRSTRPRDILRLPADILFLAGRGEAFSARGAASVKATIIVDMTACICDEAETVLRQRGLFFVPSIIATCGEVIASFLRIRSGKPALQAGDVRKETEARLEAIFPKVVSTADRTGLSMTEAVLALGIQALL